MLQEMFNLEKDPDLYLVQWKQGLRKKGLNWSTNRQSFLACKYLFRCARYNHTGHSEEQCSPMVSRHILCIIILQIEETV